MPGPPCHFNQRQLTAPQQLEGLSDDEEKEHYDDAVNENLDNFVYLKADLINPEYVSLLRRYLIMNEIADGRDKFAVMDSGRPFIMRKLTTRLEVIQDDDDVWKENDYKGRLFKEGLKINTVKDDAENSPANRSSGVRRREFIQIDAASSTICDYDSLYQKMLCLDPAGLLSTSKNISFDDLNCRFLNCFSHIQERAAISYYQKSLLEEAIKL